MLEPPAAEPDSSAVRTALWRALHVQVDAPPHLIADELGLRLVAPEPGWQDRGDMHPEGTRPFRAAIVARTRYVEDLVTDDAAVTQYLLLGAGLDTFAQRHPELADRVTTFEIDQPGPQAWKRRRLEAEGLAVPRLVPVDFDAGDDWWAALLAAGFDRAQPTVVSSSGVSMYITKAATEATLATLASGLDGTGSTVAMTFMLPFELLDPADRPGLEGAARGAEASGTPWISFYAPDEIVAVARAAGFIDADAVTTEAVAARYGVQAAGGEGMLVARR